MKELFGSGEFINYGCRVVRATSRIKVTGDSSWQVVNGISQLFPTSFSGERVQTIWLGDFGSTGNYVPNPPVQIEYREKHEWIQNLGFTIFPGYFGKAFLLSRKTPFEIVSTKKGSEFVTLRTQRDDYLNYGRVESPVNMSPVGDIYCTTKLDEYWGGEFDVTLVRSKGNFCSYGLAPPGWEPPSFEGKISNDSPDGDIADEPQKEEPTYNIDVIFITSHVFTNPSRIIKPEKFQDYGREFSYVDVQTVGQAHYATNAIPPEILSRQGVSFVNFLSATPSKNLIAVILPTEINYKRLERSMLTNTSIDINFYSPEGAVIVLTAQKKEAVHPSQESKSSYAKIWSYSFYDD